MDPWKEDILGGGHSSASAYLPPRSGITAASPISVPISLAYAPLRPVLGCVLRYAKRALVHLPAHLSACRHEIQTSFKPADILTTMGSARLQIPDEQAIAEKYDMDKAGDNAADEEGESSEDESEDEREQGEDVKAQFEGIIAGFNNGSLDINTITSNSDEYNYLDRMTNDHNAKNLLHMIAEKGYSRESPLRPLVKHLISHHQDLIGQVDNPGITPLRAAIMAGIASLVSDMCSACGDENLNVVLAIQDSKGNNCLHEAMLRKGKNAIRIARKLISRVRNTKTLRAQNNDHNTPLHIAVEWERCTKSQMDVVCALVRACDAALDVNVGTAELSVYRYHEKTRREAKAGADNKEENSSHKLGEGAATSSRNAKESLKGIPGAQQVPKAPDQSRSAPRDQLSRSNEQPQNRYKDAARERQEIPMLGIQRQPTRQDMSTPMITHPDESKSVGKTAGTMSPALSQAPRHDTNRKSKKKKEEEPATETTANEIRDFLKLHYMGTREDHESIVSFLYGPVQG